MHDLKEGKGEILLLTSESFGGDRAGEDTFCKRSRAILRTEFPDGTCDT